jgi:hypothetical protein
MDDPSTAALVALSYENNIEAMRRVLALAERDGRALGLTVVEIQHAIDALEQQRRHFALLAAKD